MLRFYLDFDGVIAHSAVECINTAFNAWIETSGNFFGEIDFEDRIVIKSKIIDQAIANRQLVVPPEHFYCLLDVLAHELLVGYHIPSAERIKSLFLSSVETTSSKIFMKFRNDFFSYRNNKFSLQSDAEWVHENPPTPFIGLFFKLIEKYPNEVLVVSRKNYKSIEKWSAGSKLPFGKLYGNEALCQFNNNKFDLIESLQRKKGYPRAFFVDDMVTEFESLDWQAIGVTTFVAGWGYNNLADNTLEVLTIIKEYLDDLYH